MNSATLKLCFTLHYLLPWAILLLVGVHLILLHEVGSTTPLAYSGPLGKGYFFPYYAAKDRVGLIWLLVFYLVVL